ncbi:MAG: T9SS type A sorting domain-containing protein [Saprospiraceae bacterium]|nr:T9SS type A sorting domain-containing protein [Saprospiraceae bacterium]
MKKFSKLVVILITMVGLNLQAQVEVGCGTFPSSDSLMETLPWYGNNEILDSFTSLGLQRLAQNNSLSVRSSGNSCPDIDNQLFLPIKFFWILGEDEDAPTEIRQQLLIDWINEFYQNNGMPFRFYAGCPISWVNPDRLFINNDIEAYFMYLGLHAVDAINVYVVDGISGAGGTYNSFGDFIYVTKTIFNSRAAANTLSHELGHFFGLEHTHKNIHSDPCKREVVSRTRQFNLGCGLFKWGKVCDKNGDALCDTPADPNDINPNTGFARYTCPYSGTEPDLFGAQFVPDETNIMSYFGGCRSSLSNGQKGVIWHNLLTKHDELLELDADFLNPDKYEPDQTAETARLITVGESQCHSMHNYCNDEVDYLKVIKIPFIGYYYFEIEDVLGSNNPVDDVKIFNRNSNGSNGLEIITSRSSNNGIRRFAILCSDITSNNGINIEIKRNTRSEGKYIASLTKSNKLEIDNDSKDCLSEGDVLFIKNLPPNCIVNWSSFKFITFSNNGQGNPVSVISLNGSTPPIVIRATITQSNGCYEQVSREFSLLVGSNPPIFEINEIEPPCRVHGFVYYEGYYETRPRLDVQWEVSDGSLNPAFGDYTTLKPDQLGWITLSATYNDGCALPRTVFKQIYVDNCDELSPKLIANPNPSDGQIQVSVENVSVENPIGVIQIVDMTSNILLQQSSTGNITTIDVSSLQNGVYYLTWSSSQINISKMIIVNH